MSMLSVRGLTVRFGAYTIVEDVSFSVEEGEWMMIVGPNGAGKTTLVRAVAQSVPYTGAVLFEGGDLRRCGARAIARKLGVLTQRHGGEYAFTVEEVVRLGRYAHKKGFLYGDDAEDARKVGEALEMTGLSAIRMQRLPTLSGGELQRVFLAQAFAQDPKLLLLDEPTNHLDLVFQRQTSEMIRAWIARKGRAAVSVVHDLSLAKAYGTSALLLAQSRTAAYGTPDEALSRENLQSVYGMDVYAWMNDLLSVWTDGMREKA